MDPINAGASPPPARGDANATRADHGSTRLRLRTVGFPWHPDGPTPASPTCLGPTTPAQHSDRPANPALLLQYLGTRSGDYDEPDIVDFRLLVDGTAIGMVSTDMATWTTVRPANTARARQWEAIVRCWRDPAGQRMAESGILGPAVAGAAPHRSSGGGAGQAAPHQHGAGLRSVRAAFPAAASASAGQSQEMPVNTWGTPQAGSSTRRTMGRPR